MSQNGKETGSHGADAAEVQGDTAAHPEEDPVGLGDFLGHFGGTIEAAIAEVEAATVEDNGSAEAVADADIETITEADVEVSTELEDTKPEDRDTPPNDEVDQEAITKLRPENSIEAAGVVQRMAIPQHNMPSSAEFLMGYPEPPEPTRRGLVPSTIEESVPEEGEPTIWELMRSGKMPGEEALTGKVTDGDDKDDSGAEGPVAIEKRFGEEEDFDLDEVLRLERIGEMLEAVRTFNFDTITIDTETEQAQAALIELLNDPCNQVSLDIELILGKPEVVIRKRAGEEYVEAMKDAVVADFEAVVESFLEGMKIEGVSS